MISEIKSKQILRDFKIHFAQEIEAKTVIEAVDASNKIGYPVVIKLCADAISHKTERGLVRLGIKNQDEALLVAKDLLSLATSDDGEVSLLVAKMEAGRRELIVGLIRDPQFGPFVMCGLGGIFAEVLNDFVFAPVPVSNPEARRMISRLRQQNLLGDFRGEKSLDIEQLNQLLIGVSDLAAADQSIISVDINPCIIRPDGSIVAVDALIEKTSEKSSTKISRMVQHPISKAHFAALFDPKGVVVVGASSHPGKFGFVSLHNILTSGYNGDVFATNLEKTNVLGVDCLTSISELPADKVDLAFVCTPASTNKEILALCAKKNIKAVYLTSAGYGEAGDDGTARQSEICEFADQLGLLLIGPNGQGVVSTPSFLCAQIVGPYPPRGSISVVSQSGNFVSSFMNYSRQTNIGIARAVSAGNAAQVGVAEFLEFFASDSETKVVIAYIEGVEDGYQLSKAMRTLAINKPLVVLKGGASQVGALAATSHTGALATDDRIFDGVCASSGVVRVSDAERAFDVAATFATQPLPKGSNTIILTTVGGWGVVTSDVISDENILNLMSLPDDLLSELSKHLPSRWSHNNPVDCAGGETRDTIAEVMGLIARHEEVDSIIFLGLGIQSNQARMMREGEYFQSHDLDRIVKYHERQDQSYAILANELSIETGKPILVATELGIADPMNAGVVAVRETGRLCYANGQRAARALGDVYKYAKAKGVAK